MNKLALALVISAAALVACSKQEAPAPAPEPAPAPAAAPAPAPAPATPAPAPAAESAASAATTTAAAGASDPALGKTVFNKTCALCHVAGVAGAPKPGDKADWGPRIAQGNDVLYKHAIEGFTGSKGQMPPKGGNTALSDAEVKAGVDYMVSQSR